MKKTKRPGAQQRPPSSLPRRNSGSAQKFWNGKSAIFGGMSASVCPTAGASPCNCFAGLKKATKIGWCTLTIRSRSFLASARSPVKPLSILRFSRRARDVNAAVHCHASMCVALSIADKPVSCVHVQSNRFGRGVPIYPRPIYILDEFEGADLARTLGNANGMMIKGHGIVTVGKSIDDACMNAVYMERTAKIMAMAQLFGFSGVPDEFIGQLSSSKEKLLSRGTRLSHSAEWNYYADKIKKGERWTRGWA